MAKELELQQQYSNEYSGLISFRIGSVVGRGNPFHGLRAGSCLILGNELSKEMCAVKARDFIGKGCLGGGQEGEGS